MEKETAIDKIKKLFALASCKASTQSESANAIAKAQRIMLQHKIEHTDLKEEVPIEEDTRPLNMEDYGKSKLAKFKVYLSTVLAKSNGCVAMSCGPVLQLFGKPEDMRTVRFLYSHCVREIERLTKAYGAGRGRTFCNNFRFGCVDSIYMAIRKEEESLKATAQAEVDERSLVVLSSIATDCYNARKFAKSKYKVMKRQKGKVRGDKVARYLGRQAGKSIYKGKRAGAIEN